ncbi:MAG: class I SAM-dependent methyltransferase [Candidatus Sericytochromatia bacterium]
MKKEDKFIEINKKSWDNRVEIHSKSEFYSVDKFLKGKTSLNSIELELLNDIKNKSILHLQCHFGLDTISLARLGAIPTGVDFSEKAIEKANSLAKKDKKDINFICSDIYNLTKNLDKKFDIVFTSYGTIGWLPDLDKWAKIISYYLKPNGVFIFVEFHPLMWIFDNNFKKISYDYFNTGAIIEKTEGTYADKEAKLIEETVSWNHSISEVINSLIKNDLRIELFDEFDYSPYNCFNNSIEIEPNKFRVNSFDNKKIPMVYSIKATKNMSH